MTHTTSQFFSFIESLWVFLPGGKIRLATIDPSTLGPAQQKLLMRYRNAVMGLTASLFALLVYARVWTLMLGIIAIAVCLLLRSRSHRQLVAELNLKPDHL